MNDPIKIGVLWGIIGTVFGLVVMFGGKALIGGDGWPISACTTK